MSRPGARGYTLVELLMALGVSMIVVAAALALMNAQQRTFRAGTDERQVQEAGRVAIEEITSNLRMAGFGVDPVVAFDFGPLPDAGVAQAPSGTVAPTPAFHCPAGKEVVCRDRIDGSDEIVFRSRDASFGRRLTKTYTTDTITVNGPLGAPLKAGQVLQVVCYTAPMTWAYVTVASDVAVNPSLTEVPITLLPGDGTTFTRQNQMIADGACYGAVAPPGASPALIESAAKVFKVDTYRYYVDTFAGRPYLMLDQGLAEPMVVAPDVEDLQFVYVFPGAPDGAQRAGDVSGTRLANGDGVGDIDLAPADGLVTYFTPGDSPARRSHHPANIRLVRVSAVVRAAAASSNGGDDTLPAAGNRPALTGRPLYRRFLLESSASTRNLDTRAPYFPSWSLGLDPTTHLPLDTLNQGGG